MARYANVRAGFPGAAGSPQAGFEPSLDNPAELFAFAKKLIARRPQQQPEPERRARGGQAQRGRPAQAFHEGHPFQIMLRKRASEIFYDEMDGGFLERTISSLDTVLEQGARVLRQLGEQAGKTPEPEPGAGKPKPPRPLYTPAMIIRAAAEMRRLVNSRRQLMDEAMARAREQFELAQSQIGDSLTSQGPPGGLPAEAPPEIAGEPEQPPPPTGPPSR